MAVAFSSATSSSIYNNTTGYSFSYSHSGNALCIFSSSDSYYSETPASPTITYGLATFTKLFTYGSGYTWYNIQWDGYYLLNAAASGTITVSFGTNVQDSACLQIVSISGASTTVAPTSGASYGYPAFDGSFKTTLASIPSQADQLAIGFANMDGEGADYISAMNGTGVNSAVGLNGNPVWYNYLTGSSPNATISATWWDDGSASSNVLVVAGFSFAPSIIPPTPTGGVTIVSGISDPGDVTIISGVSIKHTGTTLVDFT